MSAAYYLEIMHSDGSNGDLKSDPRQSDICVQRHAFVTLPIRIGRAYDNDLILDDAYVGAHHAIIKLSGSGDVVMRDLGSKNGLVFEGQLQAEVLVDGNSVVTLGTTRLRIRAADFTVAEELLLQPLMESMPKHQQAASANGWRPALAGLAIIVLLSLSSVWLTDTEQFSAIRYIMATALILGIVLIWCGGWAFANRVFGSHASFNQARFGRHLLIVACGLLVMDLWDIFSITAAYAFSIESLTRYSEHVVMLGAAAIILFHLRTINPERTRRFAMLCGLLVVLGSGLILMNNYQRYGRLSDELYMTYILPPQVRVSPNQPVAQFIQDAATLKIGIDADRLKPVRDPLLMSDEDTVPESTEP